MYFTVFYFERRTYQQSQTNAQHRAKRTSDTADRVSTAVILSEPGRLEASSEVEKNRRRFRMDGR